MCVLNSLLMQLFSHFGHLLWQWYLQQAAPNLDSPSGQPFADIWQLNSIRRSLAQQTADWQMRLQHLSAEIAASEKMMWTAGTPSGSAASGAGIPAAGVSAAVPGGGVSGVEREKGL